MSFDRKKDAGLPATVVSAETMLGVIETLGIVPFFENPIPGYSIEEMTARENWFDGQEDLRKTPWDWKIPVVQSGDVAYGKFLWGGKAAFATVEWYAELMNWRRSLEKYQPTAEQQQVMDWLAEHGSIGIKEIRALLGVKKSAADALMTRLQMQCRVVTAGRSPPSVRRNPCSVSMPSRAPAASPSAKPAPWTWTTPPPNRWRCW